MMMKRRLFVFFILIAIAITPAKAAFSQCYLLQWSFADLPSTMTDCAWNTINHSDSTRINYCQVIDSWAARVTISSYPNESAAQTAWETARADAISQSDDPLWEVLRDEANLVAITMPSTDGSTYINTKIWSFYNGCIIEVEKHSCEYSDDHWSTQGNCNSPDLYNILSQFVTWAKELIDSKCGSECNGEIPLPVGANTLHMDASANPILEDRPEYSVPLGLGEIAGGGNRGFFSLGLCKFAGPVDVYLLYYDIPGGVYVLNSSGIAETADFDALQPYLRNIDESIQIEIDGNFGGLFQDDAYLPPGDDLEFGVGVAPAGSNFFVGGNYYLWTVAFSIESNETINLPDSRQMFIHDPVAVASSGTNPSVIRPFALGPDAIGGDGLAPHFKMFYFESGAYIDIHFALYCPSLDEENVYFFVPDQPVLPNVDYSSLTLEQYRDLLWEKIPISEFRLPENKAWWRDFSASRSASTNPQGTLFAMFSLENSVLTSTMPVSASTLYMFAVSPSGVSDKYYAWVTYSDYMFGFTLSDLYYNGNY